jgi:hypothetical protein
MGADPCVLASSVWCATFCSGLGLRLRAIHESADNNGTSQSGIPSTLNTVAGHDGFNEFFDHTGCKRTGVPHLMPQTPKKLGHFGKFSWRNRLSG